MAGYCFFLVKMEKAHSELVGQLEVTSHFYWNTNVLFLAVRCVISIIWESLSFPYSVKGKLEHGQQN